MYERCVNMKTIKFMAFIGVILMSVILIYAFVNGNFFEDGGLLISNPWGLVSLVDLYVGFILFSMWIIYRESSLFSKIIWVFLMMTFGFLTASIYLLYAAYTCENDFSKLFHGHRYDKEKDKS